MTAHSVTVHEVISTDGRFISAYASSAKAASMADRIGATTATAQINVGERVTVRWHGHIKPAEVVAIATPAAVMVRFVGRAGQAPIERRMSVADVERRRR
jgi:hypothetical protein